MILPTAVEQIQAAKRSGVLHVQGKRNKFREVPLNSTAREALTASRATVAKDAPALFCSHKTGAAGDTTLHHYPVGADHGA